LAIEESVLFDAKDNIQIAGRAAVNAGFSHSGEANAGSVLDASRNFRVYGFLLDDGNSCTDR
jgi:hypothetical protein